MISVHLPNGVARHCIPVLDVSGPTHGFELAVQNEQPRLTWGMLRDIVDTVAAVLQRKM